jgi:hypothetical protein
VKVARSLSAREVAFDPVRSGDALKAVVIA